MRPEASLMGAGVPRETACCQWFPGGQVQDLTGETSKVWCNTNFVQEVTKKNSLNFRSSILG